MMRFAMRLAALSTVFLAAGAAAQALNPFEPPPPVVRVADRVPLKGNELGTMWTFENAPLEYWKTQYNFSPDKAWLDHARLSSVRYGESCSASFVSANGLVMTNHHCARECVEQNSTQGTDFVVQGFYAATRAEEKLCPDLFLDQLQEIENVTARMHGLARPGATATATAEAQAAEIEKIEAECTQQSKLTCQVVSLYHGGQYQLYKYKRFSPVKLVFAPELAAGFFGGDPDNFTYPRYNLDVSFVRAYEADGTTAVKSNDHYFKWRAEGAREEELVFVTGNPGSTSRQITFAELMYEKVFRQPFLIQLLEGQRNVLQELSKMGPEAEQQVRQQLFEIENSVKSYKGQFSGLQDSVLAGRKLRWEREFRQKVNADPKLKTEFGDVWDKLADLQLQKLRTSPKLNVSNPEFVSAPHIVFAAQLVEYVTEMAKPEALRPDSFREQAAQIEQFLKSPVPVNAVLSQKLLELQLAITQRWLDANDPLLRDYVRPGESVEQAARRLIAASKVLDAAYRQSLMTKSPAALATDPDPMIRLARTMAPVYKDYAARWPLIQAAERVQEERLAKALFAAFGTRLPPDATFTLRITDGVTRGYPYNGTIAPMATSYYGIYGRSVEFGNQDPFTLPKSFEAARSAVNLASPFNFVSTNDITGGNSGSPVIDREGRIVGIAFDSNIEALPNEFLYRDDTGGRTVSVHSAGITEALRTIYKAEALLRELLGQ
ncbi:MAG: S46 family peptidase [Gemmatimonadota bacterium]